MDSQSPRALTPTSTSGAAARRWGLVAAFAAVYLVWGSTYLAIRFAIETLPPFLMAATRFLTAGTLLYAWARFRGAARPTRVHWGAACVIGGLLLFGGNGCVVHAEKRVASGIAALLVATVPLVVVLIEWLRPGGSRPARGVAFGVLAGFGGVALLVSPGELAGAKGVDLIGAGMLMFACLCWALGSIYSKHAPLPPSLLLATAMEMLCGGALLLAAGVGSGEAAMVRLDAVSPRSAASLLYLIVFGSLLAFSCYVWLLRVASATVVSTYAYVNPVVAILLGWLLAGEPLAARTGIAMGIILGSVVLITRSGSLRSAPAAPSAAGSVEDLADP